MYSMVYINRTGSETEAVVKAITALSSSAYASHLKDGGMCSVPSNPWRPGREHV